MEKHTGIGLMSGTSLDGLDMACCTFTFKNQSWSFSIEKSETIPYPPEWIERLSGLHLAGAEKIQASNIELGKYMGEMVSRFISKHTLNPDFVASHGHTILHEPEKGVTLQIGDGQEIYEKCGITLINDFRSQDVAMGGQGAPLVPIGDRLIFHEHDYCMNIGGIANISYEEKNRRIAFDICPANMVLNKLAGMEGKAYDDGGEMARSGRIIESLLQELESLPYYRETGPRSLGKEWVEANIFPLLQTHHGHTTSDLLCTFCEHIALRTAAVLHSGDKTMLVSGGGAYNTYLLERIAHLGKIELAVPDPTIIEYKEALIFALLGVLRLKGINNVLSSVTGAPADHCAGTVIDS